MTRIPVLTPEQRWECPNCTWTDVTYEAQPHTRYHDCRGLNGLSAPMVPAGSDCEVVAVEREDYIGREDVTYDGENRPVMAVETRRADGSNDVAVYAPCANTRLIME